LETLLCTFFFVFIYEKHDNIKLQFQWRRVFETETQILTP